MLNTSLKFLLFMAVFLTSCLGAPNPSVTTDFAGNPCDQPVYIPPGCPKLPDVVELFFGDLHEQVFRCNNNMPVVPAAPDRQKLDPGFPKESCGCECE